MPKRDAVVIGIDEYPGDHQLRGCVEDATRIAGMLGFNGAPRSDVNFDVRTIYGGVNDEAATTPRIRNEVANLFARAEAGDELLFYFAGHARFHAGVYELLGSDFDPEGLGVTLYELVARANASRAAKVTLVLDCCYSGAAGDDNVGRLQLRDGMSILAASSSRQSAYERLDRGDFTEMLLHGLEGAAADLTGVITLPSLFSFVAQGFPDRRQAPVLKSYDSEVTIIRRVGWRLSPWRLCRLVEHFKREDHEYPVDMTYDDGGVYITKDERTPKQRVYYDFRGYRDHGLVEARIGDQIDPKGLWLALKDGGVIRLTQLGRHYWRLVKRGVIRAPPA